MTFGDVGFGVLLLLSLAIHPTFAQIGPVEILFAVSLFIFALVGLYRAYRRPQPLEKEGVLILGALTLFLTTFISSTLMGFVGGADWWSMIRAALPYLGILGALGGWYFSKDLSKTGLITVILFVGLVHVSYLVWLYMTSVQDITSTYDVFLTRITLFDPRTTEPFYLGLAILPLGILAAPPTTRFWRYTGLVLALCGIFGAFLLLSRAAVLAVVCGYSIFLLVWLFRLSPATEKPVKITGWIVAVPILSVLLTLSPPYRTLLDALALRTAIEMPYAGELDTFLSKNATSYQHVFFGKLPKATQGEILKKGGPEQLSAFQQFWIARSSFGTENSLQILQDLINDAGVEISRHELTTLMLRFGIDQAGKKQSLGGGRLEGEWVSAVKSWSSAEPFGWGFGIGSGQGFPSLNGTNQTYVHNYPLHLLLFNGFFGLAGYFIFYGALCVILARRAPSGTGAALSALALLVSLSVYALFFAVHKLLSFNLLIFAITWMALEPERKLEVANPDRMIKASNREMDLRVEEQRKTQAAE